MTAALHLAPLVDAGIVRGPVDVYEATPAANSPDNGKISSACSSLPKFEHQPGSGAIGRNIGVGIWSTAWHPFLDSPHVPNGDSDSGSGIRESFANLLRDLEACGSYVGEVGYRSPEGGWLVRSSLNATPRGIDDVVAEADAGGSEGTRGGNGKSGGEEEEAPALLFLREKDLLSCLRRAVNAEEARGTLRLRSGTRIEGLARIDGASASLARTTDAADEGADGNDDYYHLIVAADGLNSNLRHRFNGRGADNHHHYRNNYSKGGRRLPGQQKWERDERREANSVDDRKYVVFRGNAPKLTGEEELEEGLRSFQTWGEDRRMRFAAVPFKHKCDVIAGEDGRKDDEEVWFATISSKALLAEGPLPTPSTHLADLTPIERKERLLSAFEEWHKPVRTLIETTPPEDIIFETAVAHRFNAAPVSNAARVLEHEMRSQEEHGIESGGIVGMGGGGRGGPGPVFVFAGDAMMTVDPVLAQGFTMAMEEGASLAESVERVCGNNNNNNNDGQVGSSSGRDDYDENYSLELLRSLRFDPIALRKELRARHRRREARLINVLRSTELVEVLAQPTTCWKNSPAKAMLGIVSRRVARPLMKLGIVPEGVKKMVFDYVIRYSLGLTIDDGGNESSQGGASKDRDGDENRFLGVQGTLQKSR